MPWRCRTTSASRRNRKTAENLSAVFSCRRAFYAFAGWVLTTAISRDTGATYVDGSAFVKLSVPIFHWGERRRAVGAARAVQLQQDWNAALVHDDIVREEMKGWTALVQSRAQVDASEESLRIAGENLSISTYSYGEGLATILDVLQAQLSWIQLYSNAIRAHYNYAVAVSDYQRITAQ